MFAGDWAIMQGDAREMLWWLPTDSVDLILTDPPYYRVKGAAWDRQWDTPSAYLEWLDSVAEEWQRVLKPNGSLYVFASPRMAARVEVLLSERFNVLNHLVWRKPTSRGNQTEKEALRSFFPASERIIFCEQYGSDERADSDAGWTEAEMALKKRIFGDYLASEFDRAGVTRKEIAALFPSKTGGIINRMSNWLLGYGIPTPDQWDAMRDYLNGLNGGEYLRREYEYLRREYEELRREYEELRREYEELRRPFNLTDKMQYTDVWDFRPVATYAGKHECEKPQALLRHIIQASSRPGDLVLDSFAGSGSTGVAALALRRRFIGIEMSEHWARYAERRLAGGVQLTLEGVA